MTILYQKIFSKYLNYEKNIRIYLPKNYNKNSIYKIIYLHDGQNVFNDFGANIPYKWDINCVMETLVESKKIEPFILVGIDNNDRRYFEYSPFPNNYLKHKFDQVQIYGGDGDKYADFIVKELKPFIEKNYNVDKNFTSQTLLGSSMGAYISLYIAGKYPNEFANFGLLSIATWFNQDEMLKFINNRDINPNKHFFLSVGTIEMQDSLVENFSQIYLESNQVAVNALKKQNLDVKNVIIPNGEHNEKTWKLILPEFFSWLNKR